MRFRGIGLAVATVALAVPATSFAAKGDVFATDLDGPVIWKFGPDGGEAQLLSDDSDLVTPIGMALNRDGSLLVANDGGGDNLLRVDRTTGATSVFSDDPLLVDPFDVAVGADKMIYATSRGAQELLRVDPSTGDASTITDDVGTEPTGLAVSRKGIAYVADFDSSTIFPIDTRDGSQGTPLSDPLLEAPEGVALSPDERFFYAAGTSFGSSNLVRFDLRTGDAIEIVDLDDARAVSLFPDGSFLISEYDLGDLTRVGPTGSPITTFSDDDEIDVVHETVVEPKRCSGKFPTVVGTTGRDKLKGSKFADVISTLGGNDKVNAGKGKDIVCGGKGKDKLKGGKGRDKLKGGKGKDKLIGGPGNDVERQ